MRNLHPGHVVRPLRKMGFPLYSRASPLSTQIKRIFRDGKICSSFPYACLGLVRGSSKESTHSDRTYQIQYATVILRTVANVVYCALNGDRSVRAANRCGGRRDEVEVEHKSHGIKWPLPNRRGRLPSPQVFCTNSHGTLGLFKSHLQHWWPRACTCCLRTACLSLGRCCFCFAVVSARLLLLSLPRVSWSCLVVAAVALGLPSLPEAAGEAARRCRAECAAEERRGDCGLPFRRCRFAPRRRPPSVVRPTSRARLVLS